MSPRADLGDVAILEPDLVIYDPHHHLWDQPPPSVVDAKDWAGQPVDRYMAEELRADVGSGHNVVGTVFVECASGYRLGGAEAFRPVGETDFVVASDPAGLIGGIVGYADLREREIEAVLAAHVEAGAGRFRGVRNVSSWDASPELAITRRNQPGLLSDSAFRAGVGALGRAGLSFDAWLYHHQIPEMTDLARAHSEVTMVIDHLGGPLGFGPYRNRREEVLSSWQSAMTDLATCPNVVVKLGGIGMPLFGMDWHEQPGGATSEEIAARWGAQIRWCIELFGTDRCMFESNFPVDKVSFSYAALWNGFKRIAADASGSEKAALFHDTATRIYRL